MELNSLTVGNPISLLIERLVYLAIGIFFMVALYTGIQRGRKDWSNLDLEIKKTYPNGTLPVRGLTKRCSIKIPVIASGSTQIVIKRTPKNLIELEPSIAFFVEV